MNAFALNSILSMLNRLVVKRNQFDGVKLKSIDAPFASNFKNLMPIVALWTHEQLTYNRLGDPVEYEDLITELLNCFQFISQQGLEYLNADITEADLRSCPGGLLQLLLEMYTYKIGQHVHFQTRLSTNTSETEKVVKDESIVSHE